MAAKSKVGRKRKGEEEVKLNEAKWGKDIMAAGWTCFPSVFIEKQRALGLNSVDVNILLFLAKCWWKKDNLPFPGKKAMAAAMGLSPRTIQRHVARMVDRGVLTRKQRKRGNKAITTNEYSFAPLITEAKPYAAEMVKAAKLKKDKRVREELESVTD